MASPYITFVVTCYNYGRFLGECLRSILAQQGGYDYEIVVVDDGSTDDTQQVLREFAGPRVRTFLHPSNLGETQSVAHGYREARGELVARIDPDDRYRPHFLAQVVTRLESYPDVPLAYGDAALIDEHGKVTLERTAGIHQGREHQGNELLPLLQNNHICSATVMARRLALATAMPPPDWLVYSDWYYSLMLARQGDFCYVPEVLAEYRVHSQNLHSQTILRRTEEPSFIRLVEYILGLAERDPELEIRKRAAAPDILAAQYLQFARKYFFHGMYADARRCFLQAIRRRPAVLADRGVLRQLAGTLMGRRVYEAVKAAWTR
jgi:glycosyltransferase involved in cell wall biosynthesis